MYLSSRANHCMIPSRSEITAMAAGGVATREAPKGSTTVFSCSCNGAVVVAPDCMIDIRAAAHPRRRRTARTAGSCGELVEAVHYMQRLAACQHIGSSSGLHEYAVGFIASESSSLPVSHPMWQPFPVCSVFHSPRWMCPASNRPALVAGVLLRRNVLAIQCL